MRRDPTRTRVSSLLLLAAGAVAGFALVLRLRPKRTGRLRRPSVEHPVPAPGPALPSAPTLVSAQEALENRVLEVFRHDLTVQERAIDISALGHGVVELTGWVDLASEVGYTVTLARGVPGVTRVVDRLAIRGRHHSRDHSSGNYAAIDPAAATPRHRAD